MIHVCHNIHLFFEQVMMSSKTSLILKSCFFHAHRQLLCGTIVDLFKSSDYFLFMSQWYHCSPIVGKKWEPRNPVPGPFSAKIRKVNQNSESRREFGK